MAKNKTVRITFESNVAELQAVLDKEIRRKVVAMGTTYRKVLVDEVLVGQRSGRWGIVPGTKKRYQMSRSGEPPAVRTGDLRRSYKVGKVEGAGVATSVTVGSNLRYAKELEEQMNRKHMEPALRLAQPQLEEILRGDWNI